MPSVCRELEQSLRLRLSKAAERHEVASAKVQRLRHEMGPSQNSCYGYSKALVEEYAALVEHVRALQAFVEFTVYGIVPTDESRLADRTQ